MIKKLRRKFICITMVLITVVLCVMLTTMYMSTYADLKADSMMAMRRVLTEQRNVPPMREIGDIPHLPHRNPPGIITFYVELATDGTQKRVVGEDVIISDEAALQEIISETAAAKADTGIVHGHALRYLRKKTPTGMVLAFADRSTEIATLTTQWQVSLMIGIGTLLVFLIIIFFLAKWAIKPVQKSWEQQTQFVADASHELRTPITVILANANVLAARKDEKVVDCQKWLQYITAEATRMKVLVEQLLFLAKNDSADEPISWGHVSLSDVVWNTVLPFEALAFEGGKTFQTKIEPNIDLKRGDADKLKQLVAVLTDNALKYTPKGGTVHITLTDEGNRAKLSVCNSGEPIAPEKLPHLFERFYRADTSRTRGEGGYGLGLAILKSIADAHGARVNVHSDAAHGTTFTVVFKKHG